MRKNVFVLSFFIIGTLIGAGFASGKEIVTFFSRFGYLSVGLAVVCGYLFYVLTKMFLMSSYSLSVNNYGEVSDKLFKNKITKVLINVILTLSFLLVVSSMIAGSNALGHILIPNYNGYLISLATTIVSFIVTLGGVKLMQKINLYLVPIMLILLVVTCVLSYFLVEPTNDMVFKSLELSDYFMGLGSTILYVSLNLLTTCFLLIQIGRNYTQKEIHKTSVVIGITISLLIIIATVAMINSNFNIFESEMPIIALALNMSTHWAIIVSVVVWLAIFTTIVSTIYVVAEYLKKYFKSYKLSLIFSLIFAFVVSIVGFSNIVKYVYPIMGVLGLVFIILVFKATLGTTIVAFFERKVVKQNSIKK